MGSGIYDLGIQVHIEDSVGEVQQRYCRNCRV